MLAATVTGAQPEVRETWCQKQSFPTLKVNLNPKTCTENTKKIFTKINVGMRVLNVCGSGEHRLRDTTCVFF